MPIRTYPRMQDGHLGTEREVSVVPEIEYPFSSNPVSPDVTTRITRRRYQVDPQGFAPRIATRNAGVPDIDATYNANSQNKDSSAYLVEESIPVVRNSGIAEFMRVYSRIPSTQTTPIPSRLIVLPRPDNQYNGVTQLTATDIEYNQSLGQGHFQGNTLWTSGDSKLYQGRRPTAAISGRATAGTFTLTYGANTTGALNYNDTGATIAAALNALASVTAAVLTFGVTNNLMTTGALTLTITIGGSVPSGWPKKVTMSATSLTVTTSKNPVTSVVSGNAQVIYLPDHLTISSHGFDTSQRLAAANRNSVLAGFPTGFWGSVDSNTIWLPSAGSTVWDIAGDYIREYVPGNKLVRMQEVRTFYLPNVTGGISGPDDITVPIGLENAEDFLNALATLTGWQDYQSEGPSQWMGPIYQLRVNQVDLDSI